MTLHTRTSAHAQTTAAARTLTLHTWTNAYAQTTAAVRTLTLHTWTSAHAQTRAAVHTLTHNRCIAGMVPHLRKKQAYSLHSKDVLLAWCCTQHRYLGAGAMESAAIAKCDQSSRRNPDHFLCVVSVAELSKPIQTVKRGEKGVPTGGKARHLLSAFQCFLSRFNAL